MTYPPMQKQTRWWQQPQWMIASAVLLAVILVLALLAALSPSQKENATPPPPGPGGSAAPADPGKPLPTAIPTAAPTDVTWQLVGQVAVPFSASAGPRNVTATTASGYDQTPYGALISAAQLSSRSGLSSGRAIYEPTIRQQFVPSPDRDSLLAALLAASQEPARPGELSQFAAFRFVTYAPESAVIDLYRSGGSAGSSQGFVSTVTVLWRDGDWRMVAPPGGSWTSVARQATDLTGFIEWGVR